MRTRTLIVPIFAIVVAFAPVFGAQAQTKLLRFPDIHGSEVVFSYGGDLWKAPATGGAAVRLTAHPGQELFGKFSPDGMWIAFTGQYDGDEQVYVMPSAGGTPKRLTWYPANGPLPPRRGYDNQVYGWTRDGKRVLFRSTRDADGGRTETALYTVDLDGGLPVRLPMPTSGAGDFSPDGKRIVYSPLFRDFRTWKRYEGGWAQDLYLFGLATGATEKIAASPRTERDPMWIGGTIYFVSDRDGTLNLYAYDPASKVTTQLTKSTTWDVRWPGTDHEGRIVYESGGELHVLDVRTGSDAKISIRVPDDGLATRPSRISVAKNIEDFSLSPKGERAVMIARGDVFTLPIEKGPTRNLTSSSSAHDKWARWSPDGKTIAFVSDRTGEDQIWLVPQDGSGGAKQLTKEFKAMLFAPDWSPDGKRLAVSDKSGKLYVVGVEDGKVLEVADERNGFLQDHSWSPDGGHLAFSLSEGNDFRSLHLWSSADGKVRRVTGGFTNDSSPVWDPEGNYLYFLSDREYAPQISDIEWNFAGNRRTGIFALALRKDVANPFGPESDEVTIGEEKAEEEAKGKDKPKSEEKKPVAIDYEGLADRLVRVPVAADNYEGLAAKKGALLYVSTGAPFYGRDSYAKPTLRIFDAEKRKDSVLVEDVAGYALSRDGSKVLVRQGAAFHLYDAKPEAKDKKTVSTEDLVVDRVPKEEWLQIFDEVWRRYRDFFYVENMHGYDWKAIGERYRALVPHVAHRSDLNYVIGEMIAELNVGHAYIEGGDYEIPERAKVGLPGARFALDEKAGRYRIAKIFRGDNGEPKYRAPLTEVGVDVKEGDYVLAIDGEELLGTDNPYRLLQHKTDPVTLTVHDKPSMEGARKVTYAPIADERNLLYLEWVRGNREKVAKATGGRAGYLHIPNMSADGIYEFLKAFYPQIRKEGLVVDVRGNGGGNVSQWILERLDNKVMGTRFGRLREDPMTYPYSAFGGHLVCLLNETSASDGDIFPHYFREYGLGPLIGKRSWGGVVGISGTGPLIDGGTVFVPLQGTNDREGRWVIEGRGVDPDIEVENDPKSVIEGRDPQLERGIAELLEKMDAEPRKLPSRPADPVKTK
jgi:tricorn protease